MCPRCGTEKEEDAFYRKNATSVHSWCKPCFNAYCVQRWIDRKKTWVDLLGNRCSDCLGSFHYAVYDFHHVGKKDIHWNKLRLRSDEAIRSELAKCVLLCANCHRTRHANEHKG